MVEELHRVDAPLRDHVTQLLLESLGGRQRRLAAKHASHAAEGAAKPTADGGLEANRAMPEEGPAQVGAGLAQLLVGQMTSEAGGGERTIAVVNDAVGRAP